MPRAGSDEQRSILPRDYPIPAARSDESLVITGSDDDLVVYDAERRHIHQLNRTTVEIWQLCDGRRSLDDIVRDGRGSLDPELDETMVRYTLHMLDGAGLLTGPIDPKSGVPIESRRAFLKKLAAASAIAAPAIVSVTAPVAAASGAGCAESCESNSQCRGPCSQCVGGICCSPEAFDPCRPKSKQWICGAATYWDANGYPDPNRTSQDCGEESSEELSVAAEAQQADPMLQTESVSTASDPLAEQQAAVESEAAPEVAEQAPVDPITQPPVEVSEPMSQEVAPPPAPPADPILQAPPPAPPPADPILQAPPPEPPPPPPEPPPPPPEPPPPPPEPPPPPPEPPPPPPEPPPAPEPAPESSGEAAAPAG